MNIVNGFAGPDGTEQPLKRRHVAFLFLGELFLIPHLLPIAVALSREHDAPDITLFVITSVHEEIIAEALSRLGITTIVVRRAKGFRRFPAGFRETPHLPWKPQLLLRNAGAILRHDVVVVAERTSLWLPRLAQGRGAAFVYNEHGAGPHANFASPRNRAASWVLMPGEGMAARFRECGNQHVPVAVVGYVKRDFIREISGSGTPPVFPEKRLTVVYVPHWLRHKSSWWDMGEHVLDFFAASKTYNLIVAPHIRLPEFVPDFEERVARYRACPNIHIDATSFRLIDQSYINCADLYLGDGSSQVLEFAERPRPVVFLNPQGHDWANDPRFSHWSMGDVAEDIVGLEAALTEAELRHQLYAPIQRAYVARMMGTTTDGAGRRAADVVRSAALAKHGRSSGASSGNTSGQIRNARTWRLSAAAMALVALGWFAHDLSGNLSHPVSPTTFVEEANASFATSLAREQMVSQIESPQLDRREILRRTGLSLPTVPSGWAIKDVQVYPTDSGMAVAIVMRTDRQETVSLFAARAATPADRVPLLASLPGRSLAYWEAGPLAYALMGDLPANRVLTMATAIAGPA